MAMTKKSAGIKIAAYITDCENGEYDNYVNYCFELGIEPANIRGKEQSNHVYALALILLGLKFPTD